MKAIKSKKGGLNDLWIEFVRLLYPMAGAEKGIVYRIAWYYVSLAVVESKYIPISSLKVMALRLFGSKIGKGVIIRPGVKVKFPWKLVIKNGVSVGEDVWLDNVERIEIGEDAVLSQGVYICTGNHDWSDKGRSQNGMPVVIEDGVWIGAKSVVGPGIRIGKNAVVKLGSQVTKDVSEWEKRYDER